MTTGAFVMHDYSVIVGDWYAFAAHSNVNLWCGLREADRYLGVCEQSLITGSPVSI